MSWHDVECIVSALPYATDLSTDLLVWTSSQVETELWAKPKKSPLRLFQRRILRSRFDNIRNHDPKKKPMIISRRSKRAQRFEQQTLCDQMFLQKFWTIIQVLYSRCRIQNLDDSFNRKLRREPEDFRWVKVSHRASSWFNIRRICEWYSTKICSSKTVRVGPAKHRNSHISSSDRLSDLCSKADPGPPLLTEAWVPKQAALTPYSKTQFELEILPLPAFSFQFLAPFQINITAQLVQSQLVKTFQKAEKLIKVHNAVRMYKQRHGSD
jgi:hypothetical protein